MNISDIVTKCQTEFENSNIATIETNKNESLEMVFIEFYRIDLSCILIHLYPEKNHYKF